MSSDSPMVKRRKKTLQKLQQTLMQSPQSKIELMCKVSNEPDPFSAFLLQFSCLFEHESQLPSQYMKTVRYSVNPDMENLTPSHIVAAAELVLAGIMPTIQAEVVNKGEKLQILCPFSGKGVYPLFMAQYLLEHGLTAEQFEITSVEINSDWAEFQRIMFAGSTFSHFPITVVNSDFMRYCPDRLFHLVVDNPAWNIITPAMFKLLHLVHPVNFMLFLIPLPFLHGSVTRAQLWKEVSSFVFFKFFPVVSGIAYEISTRNLMRPNEKFFDVGKQVCSIAWLRNNR